MSERESRPALPPGSDTPDDESFMERWARRKSEAHQVDADPESVEDAAPAATEAVDEAAPLTDEDMPPLGELDQDSDYSAFLAAGVSPALRRRALRQLFRSPKFNVIDGLDDYCEDMTFFEPLGDIVTADMKARAEALIRDKLTGDEPREAATRDSDPDETAQAQQQAAKNGEEDRHDDPVRQEETDPREHNERDDA